MKSGGVSCPAIHGSSRQMVALDLEPGLSYRTPAHVCHSHKKYTCSAIYAFRRPRGRLVRAPPAFQARFTAFHRGICADLTRIAVVDLRIGVRERQRQEHHQHSQHARVSRICTISPRVVTATCAAGFGDNHRGGVTSMSYFLKPHHSPASALRICVCSSRYSVETILCCTYIYASCECAVIATHIGIQENCAWV